jgi:hypothetical protein
MKRERGHCLPLILQENKNFESLNELKRERDIADKIVREAIAQSWAQTSEMSKLMYNTLE